MIRLYVTAAAALALAGCAATPSLTIRPASTGIAQGSHPASFRVAEAQAHLALGNVALAAEGFRKALRDDPTSVPALTGLASCYDRMGRFDLSRVHYERALAQRPSDAGILTAFAASLDRAGASQEAARLRKEAVARTASPGPGSLALAALVQALDEAKSAVLTVKGQVFRTAPVLAPDAVVAHAPRRSGPRLERADLGEVRLVTARAPQWQPLARMAAAPARPKAIGAQPSPVVRITILNAGTEEGVAARTRTRLQQLGWKTIAIANAGRQLDRSELHYPVSLQAQGKRLARQLPVRVRAVPSETVDRIVLRLGRDAGPPKGNS